MQFVSGHSPLRRLVALAFIGIGTFASMAAVVFGLWTQANFGWSAHEVGLTFIAVGADYFACRVVMLGAVFIAVQAVSIREAAVRNQETAAA